MTAFILQPPALTLRKPLSFECAVLNYEHPLNKGLVAWWLFNEGAGTVAYDVANARSAVIGAAVTRVIGSAGQGYRFTDTANAVITLPASTSVYGLGAFTISVRSISTSTAAYSFIHGAWDTALTNVLIRATTDVYFYTYTGAQVGGVIDTLVANNLYDFHFVYDGAKMKAYKNGVLSATTFNQTGTIGSGTGKSTLSIGYDRGAYSSGINVYEYSVRSIALTAEQVMALYINPFGTPDNPRLLIEPRRTWFVPTAAAFKPYWAIRKNRVIGGGVM